MDYCVYCEGQFASKISKHYMSVHYDEEAVRRILLLPVKNEKRKHALTLLQNEGNYQHNSKVIRNKIHFQDINWKTNTLYGPKYHNKNIKDIPCNIYIVYMPHIVLENDIIHNTNSLIVYSKYTFIHVLYCTHLCRC